MLYPIEFARHDNGRVALANVVLIEDDSFTRAMLKAALEASGINVFADGSLAKVALQAQKQFPIEVAILDLDLGAGPTGIDIAHAMREANRSIGIVLLTSFSDPRLSAAQGVALPKGTRYLTKSNIHNVGNVISVILQSKFAPLGKTNLKKTSQVPLTDVQISVLKLIASGATNAQIASELSISEKSVEHTTTRILENLDIEKSSVKNARVQLVRKFSELSGGQLP